MNDAQQRIEGLHRLYVALTGLEIRLEMGRERDWFEFVKRGFTEEDLRVVVAHLKRGIREGSRNPGALKFRNLVGQLDFFEEDLAEARAQMRRKPVDRGRAEALAATKRPGDFAGVSGQKENRRDAMNAERSAKEVVESAAFKEFVALKRKL